MIFMNFYKEEIILTNIYDIMKLQKKIRNGSLDKLC